MKKNKLSLLASEMGKKGGKKTAEKGSEYFAKIGAKGAKSRWKGHKKVKV
jgi:hypothetical protein